MRFPRVILWLVPITAAVAAVAYATSHPVRIRTIRPIRRTIAETIAASGEVRGQMETNVGGQVGGRVAAVPVRSGDRGRAGQMIARIADDVLRAEVAQAQEDLRVAESAMAQAEGEIQSARAQVTLDAPERQYPRRVSGSTICWTSSTVWKTS